jgi:hypothetical protein
MAEKTALTTYKKAMYVKAADHVSFWVIIANSAVIKRGSNHFRLNVPLIGDTRGSVTNSIFYNLKIIAKYIWVNIYLFIQFLLIQFLLIQFLLMAIYLYVSCIHNCNIIINNITHFFL